jgi:hypothetical protein
VTPAATTGRMRGDGTVPMVVGVTGHRDLRSIDVPVLERLVRETLSEIQNRYPHSSLLLLSPLAEGSDRLVAHVARQCGARLLAPLPLPLDLYEQDFASYESREEFRRLLASADAWFELSLVEGSTHRGISEPGRERDRQYGQVGAFIARHSQLMLALWDGLSDGSADKVGGTGDVVRFRLEGIPPRYDTTTSPLSVATGGPVYHIVTPRTGRPLPEDALSRQVLVPARQTPEAFDELHRRMDHFNADALRYREPLAALRAASKAQLLQVPVTALDGHVQTLTPATRLTLERYGFADSLALYFGTQSRRATRQLFNWVFAASLFFNLFHSLPHPHVAADATLLHRLLAAPWLLLLFLAASLIASVWIYRRAERADYQNKHQDYRALAEALRVEFFWRMAGLSDFVVDHYLWKQRGALEWIRNTLRAWDAESLPHAASAEPVSASPARLTLVREHWVTEQRNYYARRARAEHDTLENENRKISVLVQMSLGLALMLAVVLTLPLLLPWPPLEAVKHVAELPWVHAAIMVTIVQLAVAAGLRHGYNQQMARSEHAKQFGRMSELFNIAEQHLQTLLSAGDYDRATDLLRDLGEEVLEENGDWVLLHRQRPLEVPHAG